MSKVQREGWGIRKDMTLAECLRFLSDGFHDGTETQRALWGAGEEIDRLDAEVAELKLSLSESASKIATLEADLGAARQSLYEVAAQRNELHATLEKHSINAERQ